MTGPEWNALPRWSVPFNWRAFWLKNAYLLRHSGHIGQRLRRMATLLSLYGINQATWFADQSLTPNWHQVAMNGPVFIIGHQRSGSTFLHRVLAEDPNALALNLRQMVLPAISAQNLWEAIFRPDSYPSRWLDRLQERLLNQLDPIHRVRLDSVEEDEFLFFTVYRSGMAVNSSPAVAADQRLNRLRDYRSWSETERRTALEWYRACLLKAAYRAEVRSPNSDRWIVGKNPAFSQRIPDLLRIFPTARFIHLVRNPLQTVPSRLSLVRAVWKLRLPEIERLSPEEVYEIVRDSERTYVLAEHDLRHLPEDTAITIRFEELTADPAGVLTRIYRQLRLPGEPATIESGNRADRDDADAPEHKYSLEEFGLTEGQLRRRFAPIIKTHGF